MTQPVVLVWRRYPTLDWQRFALQGVLEQYYYADAWLAEHIERAR